MTTEKTIEDVILGLQKIINPLMLLTAHFDMLKMFIEDCEYNGAIIDQNIDIIDDYYQAYYEAPENQRKQIIQELITLKVNPIYLSEFYITYDEDIEVMKQQNPTENKEYMEQLQQEVQNPSELIQDVKAYAEQL